MIDTKMQAFKLKGRLYTFTVIQLQQTDPGIFKKELEAVIAKAPKLFDKSPVVIDLSYLTNDNDLDLSLFCKSLEEQHLYLVGLQGASEKIAADALQKGIPLLKASPSQDKPLMEYSKEDTETREPMKTKVIHTPIRSGQQAVSKGGDLIVTSTVSKGAELLAEGHIHVYGILRGRALAGISGDTEARIFCQSLDAELISIAGFYRLSDTMEPQSGPCQIYLKDEHICIEPLC